MNAGRPMDFQLLARDEFLALGIDDVAYVKACTVDGERGYAIHTADGTEVAVMTDRELAMATVVQNDLQAASVH